jgi:hypothetical protein
MFIFEHVAFVEQKNEHINLHINFQSDKTRTQVFQRRIYLTRTSMMIGQSEDNFSFYFEEDFATNFLASEELLQT